MMPVTIPPHTHVEQHVIVQSMPNYDLSGRSLNTLAIKQCHKRWLIFFEDKNQRLNAHQKMFLKNLNHQNTYFVTGFVYKNKSNLEHHKITAKRIHAVKNYLHQVRIKTCKLNYHIVVVNSPYLTQSIEVGECPCIKK